MNKVEKKQLFKIAKIAKEKGFKTKTITTGFTNNYLLGGKNIMITDMCIYLWMCELQKWLEEIYNCFIEIIPYHDGNSENDKWLSKKDIFWEISVDYYGKNFEIELNNKSDFYKNFIKSKENSLKIALFESLKLIKNE